MPITDKIAAANKINEFLRGVVRNGGLRLKYRITVDPPLPEERDWERPEILVEFSGPDSPLHARAGWRIAALDRTAGDRDASPAGQRARENLLRLHESARHAASGAAHGCDGCRGEGPQDGSALQICSHVVARAPHRAPRLARSDGLATESEGEGSAVAWSCIPKD